VVLQNLELIKKLKYDDVYENFTRADDKARVYLINFKFPAKHWVKCGESVLFLF
jgi:hypothetical protein